MLEERIALFWSSIKGFWGRYKKNKAAFGALIIVTISVFVAVFADFIAPYDYHDLDLGRRRLPPSTEFFMGTDELGRDQLSGIIMGTRTSLFIGACAAILTTFIGVLVGATGGYFGGKIDDVLNSITQAIMIIPSFLLILLFVALFGASVWFVVLVIGIMFWTGTARLTRAQFLTLKTREFVDAAKVSGASSTRIVFIHILPNALSSIIVNMSWSAASAILMESSLSFLGLGDPTVVSWGMMLHYAQPLLRVCPWMAIFPGLAIFTLVMALNLLGDGLNDALNPKLKERGL